ncbi:hypothetical protein ZHAS_00008742 [Anopheles sinensis]|uniref:Uncharacterized protein n=1 Tax=Anopheles sinensis TaxID=74873 RepID=A0A084VT86_ANOSI|nr:hypothetical protein ZHAS_00008742 [Anopheles sinensis]
MAKPFALPDAPGPGGGGASSSGAGPPAGNGAPSNPNQGAPHPGYQPTNQQPQQHQQPPQSAPPVVTQGNAGAFPMAGPGHASSTPIPVAGGNNHYYHPYPQPMYHLPPGQNTHFYYPGYPGSPYAHPVGGPSNGGNLAEQPHPLPHVMTPPNSAFAPSPYLGAANDDLVQALYEALHRCGVRAHRIDHVDDSDVSIQ